MKKKKKAGLVGYGFICSKGHLPAFLEREDVEIVAVADISPERRELAQSFLPQSRIYENYSSLLSQEKDLDFVDITTPPAFHREIALAALEKGCHVICEKPLAMSTKQARDMMRMAKEQKRVLFPCHNYKHAPVVKEIQKCIQKGLVGEVSALTLQTFRYSHAKGVEEWEKDWRRKKKYSGGGITMDHGSHSFYLIFDWLKSFPISVSAHMMHGDPQWDTEDVLECSLKFPAATANVFLSWRAGARKMLYTVLGDKSGIFVDNDRLQLVHREEEKESYSISSAWMDASHVSWSSSMFQEFFDCIEKQEYIGKDIQNSYLCMELIEKCYLSYEKNASFQELNTSFSFLEN